MQLYNTLTRSKETLTPLSSEAVTIYTCGPTVYDYPHIGNWFTFIRYDVLIRTLKTAGLNPLWVMNITDVGHLVSDADEGEDKLEKGAKREGKTAWDIAQYYSNYFLQGLERLTISKPTYLPRATEHIQEQIELIKTLEVKGYTYVIDDGVYYDTSKFEGYAAFARLDLDDLQAGARVEFNTQKRHASDFALWKFSPKDQKRDMEWDSPWGKGFPGWHLECSAMAMKYLGETIDIHAGGIDHIPVHHTNEIAQSEAATGKRFANYWMHANHITVKDEKISKSLGNSITLEDIEAKGFNLEVLRLHILESHYRSQSKFSWESLESAQNRLQTYKSMASMVWQAKATTSSMRNYASYQATLLRYMQDDLNTPMALALLSEIAHEVSSHGIHVDEVGQFKEFLIFIDELLGLRLSHVNDITEEQKKLIEQREIARSNNDWGVSDAIRDQLLSQNIELRDDKLLGVIWRRLS